MSTENINRIVYFGDSQTDGGNLFELTSRLFTSPSPWQNLATPRMSPMVRITLK